MYPVLAFVTIYAAWFLLFPDRVAQLWKRDDLPVHEIMRHFRYWESRRVWIAGVGLATGAILASMFAASIITPIAMFIGLMSLTAADALRIRRLSRDLPAWSPSTGMDQVASRVSPVLDVLFGEKPTNDRRGK